MDPIKLTPEIIAIQRIKKRVKIRFNTEYGTAIDPIKITGFTNKELNAKSAKQLKGVAQWIDTDFEIIEEVGQTDHGVRGTGDYWIRFKEPLEKIVLSVDKSQAHNFHFEPIFF
jgi:hypothetical protein